MLLEHILSLVVVVEVAEQHIQVAVVVAVVEHEKTTGAACGGGMGATVFFCVGFVV